MIYTSAIPDKYGVKMFQHYSRDICNRMFKYKKTYFESYSLFGGVFVEEDLVGLRRRISDMEDENESLNLQLAKMSSAKSPRHFKVRVAGVSGGFSHDMRGGGVTHLTLSFHIPFSFCYGHVLSKSGLPNKMNHILDPPLTCFCFNLH